MIETYKIYILKPEWQDEYEKFILPEKRDLSDGEPKIHYRFFSRDKIFIDPEWWLIERYEEYNDKS
jgi:hypothetical protein